jgi:hypothetical protein
MRIITKLSIASFLFILASCKGKDKNSPDPNAGKGKDTALTGPADVTKGADSTLGSSGPFIEKELDKWAKSFKNFHIDSFRASQKSEFPDIDYQDATDLKQFYELYKPSLAYSPDSSQFIDLYSAGLMLEKKGKKIIASADVDNAVTLCNLNTRSWKQIVSFGPSAWIEEARWTSPTSFILAGVMVNDAGDQQAMMLLGDVNSKSFRWFESNSTRSQSVNYKASGMEKLKIDEWE